MINKEHGYYNLSLNIQTISYKNLRDDKEFREFKNKTDMTDQIKTIEST